RDARLKSRSTRALALADSLSRKSNQAKAFADIFAASGIVIRSTSGEQDKADRLINSISLQCRFRLAGFLLRLENSQSSDVLEQIRAVYFSPYLSWLDLCRFLRTQDVSSVNFRIVNRRELHILTQEELAQPAARGMVTQAVSVHEIDILRVVEATILQRYPYAAIPSEFIAEIVNGHGVHPYKRVAAQEWILRLSEQIVLLHGLQSRYVPGRQVVLVHHPYERATEGILDFAEIVVITDTPRDEEAVIRSLGGYVEHSWSRSMGNGIEMTVYEVIKPEGHSLDIHVVAQAYRQRENTVVYTVGRDFGHNVHLLASLPHLSRGITSEDQPAIDAEIGRAFDEGRVVPADDNMQRILGLSVQALHEQGNNNIAFDLENADVRFVMPDTTKAGRAPPHYLWFESPDRFLLATVFVHEGSTIVLIPHALAEFLESQEALSVLTDILSHETKHIYDGFDNEYQHDQDALHLVETVEMFFDIATSRDQTDEIIRSIADTSLTNTRRIIEQVISEPARFTPPGIAASFSIARLLAFTVMGAFQAGKINRALNVLVIVRQADTGLALYENVIKQARALAYCTDNPPLFGCIGKIVYMFGKVDDFVARGRLTIGDKTADRSVLEEGLSELITPTLQQMRCAKKPAAAQKPPLVMVGILGVPGSGRTIMTEKMAREYGFKAYGIFSKPKQIAMRAYGLMHNEIFGDDTQRRFDVIDAIYELLSEVNNHLYITYALSHIVDYVPTASEAVTFNNRWVIPDLMLEAEVDALRSQGALIWKIQVVDEQGLPVDSIIAPTAVVQTEEVPHHKIDRVIYNSRRPGEFDGLINAAALSYGFEQPVQRLTAPYETEFRDFNHYMWYLMSLKEEALARQGEYQRGIDHQLRDLALQFAGEDNLIERTPEAKRAHATRANVILEGIYRDETARQEFIEFVLVNQIQDSYRNRQTPLFFIVLNWLLGRPLNDRALLTEHQDLFAGNISIHTHPCFGDAPLATLAHEAADLAQLARPKDKTIRILFSGSAEKLRPESSGVLFLRSLLQRIPTGYAVEIHADDINFPERVYAFDGEGNYTGCHNGIVFNADGFFNDATHDVRLIKVDLGDPRRDLLSEDYIPQEQYDIVISSRMAVQYCNNPARLDVLKQNLLKLLGHNGILILDTEEANHVEITQLRPEGMVTCDTAIAYQDVDHVQKYVGRIAAKIEDTLDIEQRKALIYMAYQLGAKYATRNNPLFEKVAIAQLLAAFEANTTTILSVLVAGVPVQAIEAVFSPAIANTIKGKLGGVTSRLDRTMQTQEARDMLNFLYRRRAFSVGVSRFFETETIYDSPMFQVALVRDEYDDAYVMCTSTRSGKKVTGTFIIELRRGQTREHQQRVDVIDGLIARDRAKHQG
ncbi:MAG: hypothetical protein WC547_08670, partial [Candidatus Omnitrophota bacterium]